MINSILETKHSRINMDRIRIKDEDGEDRLLSTKDEIYEEAVCTFKDIFRKRVHQFDSLPDKWAEVYRPLRSIDPNIYKNLTNTLTETEWSEMLKSNNEKSAAGPSQISYKMIRKAGMRLINSLENS
jgi:hypothetical protein